MTHDPVNHPKHYTDHPSGVECIDVTEHMNFCLGNAVKYIWRADLKHDAIEDLRKARWYIEREIERREAEAAKSETEVAPVRATVRIAGGGAVSQYFVDTNGVSAAEVSRRIQQELDQRWYRG